MIHRKRTHGGLRVTGARAILIIIACFTAGTGSVRDTALHIQSLRTLGKILFEKDQYFYSYFYNLSYFLMADDPGEKKAAGLEAMEACIRTNHVQEAEFIIRELSETYPDLRGYVTLRHCFALSKIDKFSMSDDTLRALDSLPEYRFQRKVLRAYNDLNLNKPVSAANAVRELTLEKSPYTMQLQDIATEFGKTASVKKKSALIAVPLSACVPGAGLWYCGLLFDAAQSFGFNAVFAMASYASWKYALHTNGGRKAFALPLLTTGVWGVFYIASIHATINGVRRVNASAVNSFYTGILRRFENILDDDGFIGFKAAEQQ